MDRKEAYGQMLKSATASVEAVKAMLPDESWGDNADNDQRDEAERMDRILSDLAEATIPV